MALARRIADNPGHGLGLAKRLMREVQAARLETTLEMSATFQALAHATGDHRDRVESAVGQLGGGKS